MKKIPIVTVCGPTASGKTSLAIELAKLFDGEIISADSMQIYKGMDIGTAKPTEEEKQGIIHHMIDIIDISQNFSVTEFCEMAHTIIEDINSRGKLPIVAGGTGLYIDSLVNDLDFSKSVISDEIRNKYSQLLSQIGAEGIHNLLRQKDEDAADAIHMNNTKRVIRALEHIDITGQKFSDYKRDAAEKESRYNCLGLFIDMDRQLLYERIDLRVDIMIKSGLIAEARRLYNKRYTMSTTSIGAIGYKELFEYFDGKCTLDEATDLIKQSSRRYAKRQLTWFRRNENLVKLDAGDDILLQAKEEVEKFIKP